MSALSGLLQHRRREVIDRFVAAARDQHLPPEGATRKVIIDHMNLFLDGCVEWLEGESIRNSRSIEIVSARLHGSGRWAVGYDLKSLVREYGVLRDCILALILEHGLDVGLVEFNQFADVVNLGISEAVAEFTRSHDEAVRNSREEAVAVVLHELRNPLSTIAGTTTLVDEELSDGLDQASLKKHLARVDRAVATMTRLITDLQDLSRVEAARLPLTLGRERATSLLEEALAQGLPVANLKGTQLRIERTVESAVRCDRGRVLQVLANLVSNAIKFTPAEGVVMLSATVVGPDTRFEVRDTGPGIPKDQLPFLFERFWQAPEARHKGTGLGLAIAKGLVEAHGGKIGVTSAVGDGSAFHFTLKNDG